MFKKENAKITRYVDGKWFIDITHEEVMGYKSIGAYLGHKDYGITKLMFGVLPVVSDEDMLAKAESQIDFYKYQYAEEFFDLDDLYENEEFREKFFTEKKREAEYEEYLQMKQEEDRRQRKREEEKQRQKMSQFYKDAVDDLPFY